MQLILHSRLYILSISHSFSIICYFCPFHLFCFIFIFGQLFTTNFFILFIHFNFLNFIYTIYSISLIISKYLLFFLKILYFYLLLIHWDIVCVLKSTSEVNLDARRETSSEMPPWVMAQCLSRGPTDTFYWKYNANTNYNYIKFNLYSPYVDGNGTPYFVDHQNEHNKIRLRQSIKSLGNLILIEDV